MLIYVCITLFLKNNKNEIYIKLLTKVFFFSFICICICLCYFIYRFIPSASHRIGKIFKEKLVEESIKWSKVPSNMKEYYCEEFEVQFNAFSLFGKC